MIANPNVLLPEPLGPISAWVSPRLISRFTPLRIVRSPTLTCRFLMRRASVMWSSSFLVLLCGDFLVIGQRFQVGRCDDIARVMRHGQLVLELAAFRPACNAV